MFDKLALLLRQQVTPECGDAFIQSLTVLDMYGYTSSWADIAEYIEHGLGDPTALFIDTIEMLINAGLDDVLQKMTLTVDGNHVIKSMVLEGLKVLESWDDPRAIMDIIEIDQSTQETLAELLSMVSPMHTEEWLPHLLDLSPSLITAISSKYSDASIALENRVEPIPDTKVTAVRRFIKRYPNSLAATALTKEFVPYGISMDALIKKYTLHLQVLQPEAPEQAALEIIGLTLISDTEYKDIRKVTKDFLDDAYIDMDFISRMNISVDKQLTDVLAEEV